MNGQIWRLGVVEAVVLAGLFVGCGGEGVGSPPEENLAVTASPLSAGSHMVHFTAAGSATGFNGEPAIGGVGSTPSGGRSSIALRVPEGPTYVRAWGMSFGTSIVEGWADLLPGYLKPAGSSGWTHIHQLSDTCAGIIEVQAGRRHALALDCTPLEHPPWVTPLEFFDRPMVNHYLLDGGYVFNAGERFAGSSSANLAFVAVYYPPVGQAVQISTDQPASIGVFATLPDPYTNPGDTWPSPEAWPFAVNVQTAANGWAVAYLVGKPAAPIADALVFVWPEAEEEFEVLYVRTVGYANLAVGAE